MNLSGISLAGLQTNWTRLEDAAGQVARFGGSSPVNVIEAVTDLQEAKLGVDANIKVLKVANETTERLLDIFA